MDGELIIAYRMARSLCNRVQWFAEAAEAKAARLLRALEKTLGRVNPTV